MLINQDSQNTDHLMNPGFNRTQISTRTHNSARSRHIYQFTRWKWGNSVRSFQAKYIKSHPIALHPTPYWSQSGSKFGTVGLFEKSYYPREIKALCNSWLQSEFDNIMIFPQENKNKLWHGMFLNQGIKVVRGDGPWDPSVPHSKTNVTQEAASIKVSKSNHKSSHTLA